MGLLLWAAVTSPGVEETSPEVVVHAVALSGNTAVLVQEDFDQDFLVEDTVGLECLWTDLASEDKEALDPDGHIAGWHSEPVVDPALAVHALATAPVAMLVACILEAAHLLLAAAVHNNNSYCSGRGTALEDFFAAYLLVVLSFAAMCPGLCDQAFEGVLVVGMAGRGLDRSGLLVEALVEFVVAAAVLAELVEIVGQYHSSLQLVAASVKQQDWKIWTYEMVHWGFEMTGLGLF